jgi:hypothetical protein
VTARFENAVDTITVHVLAPLPEGKVLPTLTRARPAAPVSVSSATPVSSGGAIMSGGAAAVVGGAAPAPSAPVLPPSGSSRTAATNFVAPRGQASTFASVGSGAGSVAADSAAIAKIIESGLSSGAGGGGRTFVLTPMGAQVEYRVLVDSVGSVYTTGGLVFGAAGTFGLSRAFFLDGHFLTGNLKATSSTITNLYDGTFGDARLDLGYEPLAGFVLRVGYGVRGMERLFYTNKEQWTMVRTGIEGRFGMFGDRVHANLGFTYFPSVTVKGQAPDQAGTMLGANGGVTYRAGWFQAGVNYEAQSIEFNKANLASLYQRQARYSALSFTLGAHWGR